MRIASVTVLWISVFAFASPSASQPLDVEVERLLSNDCAELGLQGGTDADPNAPIGPNLDQVCTFNASDAVASAGGGAASSQANETSIKAQRALERLEEEREGTASDASDVMQLFQVEGLGVWASAEYTHTDREVTRFEDGHESDLWGGMLGVDYRFADFLMMGVAGHYRNLDGDFDGGGGFETDTYGGVVYASVTPIPEIYVDAAFGFSGKDYEVEREVLFQEFELGSPFTTLQGRTSSDTDGEEYSANVIAGYLHEMGGVTLAPRAGVNFVRTEIDGFSESGGTGLELVYADRDRQSLQSVAGLSASVAAPTGFGVVVPQVDFDWIHEFQDDQRRYRANFLEDLRAEPLVFRFQNESPDRNFFRLALGTSVMLPRGLQLFAQYRTLIGHRYFDNQGVAVGARMELGGNRP